MTEDETVGRHHQLSGHEFEQMLSRSRVTFSFGESTAVTRIALLVLNTECVCIIDGFRVCGCCVWFRILSSPFWIHPRAETKREPFTWAVLCVRKIIRATYTV